MLIYIIDVDSGNLRSLENAVKRIGHDIKLITNAEEAKALTNADRVFLPGVGNFGHFMDQVSSRGLIEPIKEYIQSGKPIMGICVGLQVLFEGSEEAPNSKGLGLLPGRVSRFDSSKKSVPHIGWDGVTVSGEKALFSIDPQFKYYFVHSYAKIVDRTKMESLYPGWDYALCDYHGETFIAALAKDNMFFTQFHPEKCGQAGLDLLRAFINGTKYGAKINNGLSSGLSERIIACLDVRTNDQGDIVVTKGDQYDVREKEGNNVRNLGKPVEVAEKYYKQGADEVTFLNITSFRNSPLKDLPMVQVLKLASQTVFVPFTIGGGIRDTFDPETQKMVPALDVASLYFRSGADKVSIGSDSVDAALNYYANGRKGNGKSPIETISAAYGAQAVVVSIDPKRVYVASPSNTKHHTIKTKFPGPNGEEYVWYQCTVKGGRETRDLGAYELAQAVEALGAGELLLNCIDKDGTNSGFDLELVSDIKNAVEIPVIASSGAGKPEHFYEVFRETKTDAALGAGMFHRGEYTVGDVKEYLKEHGQIVRIN